jgi:integrase
MPTIYKTPKSKFYQCDIWVRGRKFSRSTGRTSSREAESAARALEEELRAEQAAAAESDVSLALEAVAGRYAREVIDDHLATPEKIRAQVEYLVKHFGPGKLITGITTNDVTGLIARRRREVVPHTKRPITTATIRLTVVRLRAMFTFCRERGVMFKDPPNWKALFKTIKPSAVRVRELHEAEAERLDEAMRPDLEPLFYFAETTGKRQSECVNLRWADVHWDTGVCEWKGKAGRTVRVQISDKVRAILWPLRGHHPDKVFTYVSTVTRRAGKDGTAARLKGQRYPITVGGLRDAWYVIRARAGLHSFRFHDFRHTAATRVVRQKGNLKLAQELLDHSNVGTTATYYAHVTPSEVGAAMDGAARDKNHRRNHRSTDLKVVKTGTESG